MFLLKIENIEFEKQALISCHKLNLKNIQKQNNQFERWFHLF